MSLSYVLLGLVVFAWGFSWFAITLQVGEVSALIAVAYRFIIAAAVMCAGLVVTGRWQFVPWRHQPLVALMGACLFSMNFVSFYAAAPYLPSGVLSVIFATAALFGALNAWLFMGQRPEPKVLLAAVLGLTGLTMLLWPEISGDAQRSVPWWAVALPFLGTYLFSIGNVASAKLSKSYSLPNLVGQGMVWGMILLIILSLVSGQEFKLPASYQFWIGAVYLALIASLLAFLAYLALVNSIGTARASYSTVLFPIVAMVISALFEGYEWTIWSTLGLTLALGGTFLSFGRKG